MNKHEIGAAVVDTATYSDEARYHALFSWLRAHDPICFVEPEGFRPFWIVSKHRDLRDIELQADCFINKPRVFLLNRTEEQQLAEVQAAGLTSMGRSIVELDGVEHKLLRRVTQGWFAPSRIGGLRDRIRDIAREMVDFMEEQGGACDFVQDVALWYPLRVIMAVLGLPREDEKHLLQLTQAMFAPSDPDTDAEAGVAGMIAASQGIRDYFESVTADRRRNPRDDVTSAIANAIIDGERISDLDATGYYVTIITAGHDTTSSTTASGLLALLRNPGELAKLQSGSASLDTAVDEFLRWTTPIKHFFRTATRDVTIRDKTIKAGDSLMMCYPSANRDEEIYDDPFTFRVDRTPNPQLAFGYGPHVCLGQHLAKLEIRIFYEELLSRLQSIALTGEAALTETNFIQGLKRLPISYSMRREAA